MNPRRKLLRLARLIEIRLDTYPGAFRVRIVNAFRRQNRPRTGLERAISAGCGQHHSSRCNVVPFPARIPVPTSLEQIMSTSPRARRHAILTVAALALAGAACSSSKPIKTPGDAATDPKAATPGPDTTVPGADTAPLGSDAAAAGPDTRDLHRADQATTDALPGDKDASSAELADATDGLAADLALPTHDGSAPDGSRQDVPAAESPRADSAPDLGVVCTPGLDQTCNDEPWASWISGSCTADGACVCIAGYTVNPTTGRCMVAPTSDAGSGSDGVLLCPGEYDACGCGCCDSTPTNTACYYPTAGDTLEAIKAADDEVRATTNCLTAGCSFGTRYVCCLPAAPDPPGSATYQVSPWSGGLDHLDISKSGADCAHLGFASGRDAHPDYRVETPEGWTVLSAMIDDCGDGGTGDWPDGALGTLVFRQAEGLCLADVHVTLYAFTAAGEVRTIRVDVEGAELPAMGGIFCR